MSLKRFEQTERDLVVSFQSLGIVTFVVSLCSRTFYKNFAELVGPIVGLLTLLLSKIPADELNENKVVSMDVPYDILYGWEDLHIVVLNDVHGFDETHDDDQQDLLLSD